MTRLEYAFHMQTNLESILQSIPCSIRFSQNVTLHQSPALITPELGGYQTPRDSLSAPEPILNLLSLPHPFLPLETTRKGLAQILPSFPLPPD